MKWSELSMTEKNEVIKMAVAQGIKDISSIKNLYEESVNRSRRFEDGGTIHIDPSKKGTFTVAASKHGKSVQEFASQVLAHKENYSPAMVKKANFARNAKHWKHGDGGWLESLATTASKKVMAYIQQFPANPFTFDWQNASGDGVAQDTYLLPRKLQEKEFLRNGYIKGKDKDYGLVKKAVGNRSIPIYQKNPDAISRDKLIVLGNTYSPMFDEKHGLDHPGSAPTAVYTDGHGKYYQKQWDLNDYGGEGGSTEGIAGKLLDFVGSPTVVTTGFQEINDKIHPWFGHLMKDIIKNKGLVPTEIDGETKFTLPEITVTGKKKKAFGGNLFSKGGLMIKGL